MDYEKCKYIPKVNLKLDKKIWCTYEGKCMEMLNVTNGLCSYCRYKQQLDIPQLIRVQMEKRKCP